MIRKEEKGENERVVFYIIDKDINVSAIISELSSMGCKGEELGEAYRKLTSDNKGYYYENKATQEKLIVIDERNFDSDIFNNPMLLLFWALIASAHFRVPSKSIVEELKKGGEVVK